MPHICMDEILMFMAMFPFIGVIFARIHMWYHNKFTHKCHEPSCDDSHLDHIDEK